MAHVKHAPCVVRVPEIVPPCVSKKEPQISCTNTRQAKENIQPKTHRTPAVKTSKGPLEYQGAKGRPSESLEQLFINTPLQYKPTNPEARTGTLLLDTAANKLQKCWRFWSVPRLRARHYDPRKPTTSRKTPPGAIRLPGYELSTREAAALHYLIEHGRVGELSRSLVQLQERGTRLTEKSLLPMSTVSRQIGEPHAARAVLEFAESYDTPRSGRLYSETILTVLENASREEAEAIAWRAAKGGYLLTAVARAKLEEAGSYTAAQWRAHWQLQNLKGVNHGDGKPYQKPSLTRSTYTVVTRHRGHAVEVLSTRGDAGPFHISDDRLPLDPSNTSKTYPAVLTNDPSLCQALDNARGKSPEGHAYAQWKTLAEPQQTGRGQYPLNGLRLLLRPSSAISDDREHPLEGTNFEAAAWHVESRLGDKLFHKPPLGYEWIPLDEAVWALAEADPLQLWRHLLIQVTRMAGVTSKEPRPRIKHSPIGLPRVLVVCEESLTVNSRMQATGHTVPMSIDLLPPEYDGPRHLTGDATEVLHLGWDLLVGFPPCQHLCNSSSLYLPRPGRRERMHKAAEFFCNLWKAKVPAIALENPKMHPEAYMAIGGLKPSQTIHPHMHACEVTKPTSLYLSGLPLLRPSHKVPGRMHPLNTLPNGPLRALIKGRTFDGIARAMAQQWIPGIAARRLQQNEPQINTAIGHRLNTMYGTEGTLTGDRPEWAAVEHFRREAAVVAAILDVSSRSPADQAPQHHDRISIAANRHQRPNPKEPPDHKSTVFSAWKRQTELLRGNIFGVPGLTQMRGCIDPADRSRWIDAQRIVRDHLLEHRPGPCASIALPARAPPMPPIRRIHRRFGAWWIWAPVSGTDSAPPRHEWRRLPQDCQAILDKTAAGLRPPKPEFGRQQMPLSLPPKWRRLARGLRLRASGWLQLREARASIADLLPRVARTLGDVCAVCRRPRAGNDPCPRGLGAESCNRSPKKLSSIQFVKATADLRPRVCAVSNRVKAKEVISTHARSWRLKKDRRASPIGQATRLDRRICTAHGVGLASYQHSYQDMLGSRFLPQATKVKMLSEKTEPELVPLHLPDAFGEESISRTPSLPPRHRTHCAWLKDVLISIHNTGQRKQKAPYLVGNACAWSPAAMGDSGAAVSLIGTELLKMLPPDAVVKFRWNQSQISGNVCGPNGEPLAILGEADLLLTISRIPFRHTFQVVLGGDLLLMGADFMAPRAGDVCLRVDKGDGIAGFCTLNHPTYGRVRLPLTTDPAAPPRGQARVASVAPKEHRAAAMPQHHLLFNVTAFRVAPRSERELLLRLPDRLQDPPCDEPLLVKPLAEHRGLDPNVRVAYSLSRPRKPEGSNDLHVPVRVLNLAHTAVSIPALSPLAEMEIGSEAADQKDGPTFTPEEIQKISEELVIDPDGILSPDERRQVDELVERRLGAFAQDANAPSQTHAIEVHLPLREGAVPHRHAPPRLGVEGRRFVRENVAEMERRGIVYKTQSPWGSRIVLVRKKDGTLRQCIDYRDLNSKLLIQDSPLPRIDTCLEAMTEGFFNEQIIQLKKEAESPLKGAPADLSHAAVTASEPPEGAGETNADPPLNPDAPAPSEPHTGMASESDAKKESAGSPRTSRSHRGAPRFWCTMDLASGFHGIPIAPESQPQTAFVTPDGKYAYTRLPFGLQCAPSYMVNLMNEVMQGLQWSICVCYMDDTLVWANSFDEMLERLELVLERFIGANLSLKAKKCVLFASTVDFLGFRLSNQGIGVSPEKVETIRRINPEAINNITAVRSFLGAASFYRKHIRGFATIAKPLTELTRNGVDVATESQKDDAQAAIRKLKEALTTAPVLALPRWDRPFIVHTDACITGLGAVLCQKDEEETERPIAYWGRVLTPAEANYNVSELELLAIVCCIKQWRPYLWSASGKKFILRVDHAALLYLHTAKDTVGGGPASRLQRWYLKLQEYRFEVWHRPGRIHYDADFISRMQGNPEYAKLTREVDTPEWAKVSSESTRRHTISQTTVGSEDPDTTQTRGAPTTSPEAALTASGGAALKEGGGIVKTHPVKTETPHPAGQEAHRIVAAADPRKDSKGPRVQFSTTDLSVQETFDLLAALEARLPADERPAALEQLSIQLRKGRQIRITTLEAILLRLKEKGFGLRAAELAEVMLSTHRISKKALYLALAATHAAGLCLQSAPLQRALSTDYNVRSTGARKMLQALEMEFNGHLEAADDPELSDRLQYFVHVVVVALDGQVMWCHKPNPTKSGNSIQMSASQKCNKGKSPVLTARSALRDTFKELPPVLASALDDQLKIFPEGQARVSIPGDSPWHTRHQHIIWLVALHPPEPYELQTFARDDTDKPGWFPLQTVLHEWDPAIARAVLKAQRRHRETTPNELQAQYQTVGGEAGESLPEVQSLRRSLNSVVASCTTWTELQQLNNGRWATARMISGEVTPSVRQMVAANAHRAEKQPQLAQINDSAARAKEVWSKYAAHDVPHSEDIRREQQTDLWCSEIMEHLISEAIPASLTGPAIARFVATASEYTIREGLLFKYQRDPRAHRNAVQLAVPVALRGPFMEAFHERAGHPGIERTYQALRQRAYWPGMREAVVQHVAECHECALAKKPCQSFGTTILPGVPSRPFDTIYADVLTLPESKPMGPNELVFSKLLIFCDALTRWVEAIPLPSEPTSEEIVAAFVENIVSRFGVPRCLVCDRGSNLISKLCQEVYTLLGVDLKPSTSYHHNTSGLVERYNRTLAGLLRATGQDGTDWPLHVPWLNFLFRATPHEVTKESPAFLAFGRELRTPADLRLLAETDPEIIATPTLPSSMETVDAITEAEASSSPHTAHALKKRLEIAWDAAAHLTKAAQMSSKERRDLSRREPEYQVGDRVLVRRPVNDHTGVPEGGKLAPIYEGPYRVSEILPNGNVQLRDLKSRGLSDVFHVTRLRPYLTYTSDVQLAEDEYIVEKILARRGTGENREYLIKWKGYSSAVNGWEPQAHLMRHCMEEVAAFDAQRDAAARPRKNGDRETQENSTVVAPKSHSELQKETEDRQKRLERRSNRVAAPVRSLSQPAGSSEDARLLTLAARPKPATAARIIAGAWHFLCPQGNTTVWVDQRFFTPVELRSMRHLQFEEAQRNGPAPATHNQQTPKDLTVLVRREGESSPYGTKCRRKTPTKVGGDRNSPTDEIKQPQQKAITVSVEARGTPRPYGTNCQSNATIQDRQEDPTRAAPADPPVSHEEEQTAVPPWMALSLPHRPDVTLLRKSQRERALPGNTARALMVAVQTSQQSRASARVDELKHRLSQPSPQWRDFYQWIGAMDRMYQDAGDQPVSRVLRPEVKLQWREEPLEYLPKQHAPPRVARELEKLMELEASKRSTAIAAPDTDPLARKQLIQEEERLAQAYHYLSTRTRYNR